MIPNNGDRSPKPRPSLSLHPLARGVILHQDHILLCQHLSLDKQYYYLPGGHIESQESIPGGLLRELSEETGLTFQIKRFLGILEYQFSASETACHQHEYNFVFEVSAPEAIQTYSFPNREEDLKLSWIPLHHLSQTDLKPFHLKTLISEWLQEKAQKVFQSEGF